MQKFKAKDQLVRVGNGQTEGGGIALPPMLMQQLQLQPA